MAHPKLEQKRIDDIYKDVNDALAVLNKFVEGVINPENRLYNDVHNFFMYKQEQYNQRGLSGDEGYKRLSHTIRNVERLYNTMNEVKTDVKDKFVSKPSTVDNNYGLKKESYSPIDMKFIFDVSPQTLVNWTKQDNHPLKKTGDGVKGKAVAYYRSDIIEFLNHNPQIKVVKPE